MKALLVNRAYTLALFLLAPAHRQRVLSDHRSDGTRAAGLLHDDTPQQKLDKLDALLAQSSASIQDAALIAEMLSLQNDGRYPPRTDAAAAPAENTGSAYHANRDTVATKSCADDLRGCALG